jgi:hypothetical protein
VSPKDKVRLVQGVTVVTGVAQPEGAPVTEAEGYGQVADALAVIMVDAQVLARPGARLPGVRSFQLAPAALAAAKAAYSVSRRLRTAPPQGRRPGS